MNFQVGDFLKYTPSDKKGTFYCVVYELITRNQANVLWVVSGCGKIFVQGVNFSYTSMGTYERIS